MSGIKIWILAILVVIGFAGYLTVFSSGAECLTSYIDPDINDPANRFVGMLGISPSQVERVEWGESNGKPALFLWDTRGDLAFVEVCMTGNVMTPDVELIP